MRRKPNCRTLIYTQRYAVPFRSSWRAWVRDEVEEIFEARCEKVEYGEGLQRRIREEKNGMTLDLAQAFCRRRLVGRVSKSRGR